MKPKPEAKLAGADLALALDALDMAIDLLETVWLKDPGNSRHDVREIKANIARMWGLVERLVVHARPDHHMRFCAPSHHQVKMGATGPSSRIGRVIANLEVPEKPNGARRGARERPVPPGNGAGPTNGATLIPLAGFETLTLPPVTRRNPREGGRARARGGVLRCRTRVRGV